MGLETYLVHEGPGHWGLLPSAGLADLSRGVEQTLYTDVRAVGAWLKRHWSVNYFYSGLRQLLHQLGFSYKLTTFVPCEAAPVRQAAFLAEQLRSVLAQAEAGQIGVYFTNAAHPTHNTRSTRTGQLRLLFTVSDREWMNLNAAVNIRCPTQVHLHETGCVDAQSMKALYEKLLAAHPNGRPIYMVCDNAWYYPNRGLTE